MTDPIVDDSIETLIAEFARLGVRELHIRTSDFEIFLSNDSAARITTAAPVGTSSSPPPIATMQSSASTSARSELPENAVIVRAPNLGTFYRAPKPGAVVYVEMGSLVAVGAELCLIEVMKLFTAVRAEVSGRVVAVLAKDGAMVEAGEPLFAIVEH